MRDIYQARDLTIVGTVSRRYVCNKRGPVLICPGDSYLLLYIPSHMCSFFSLHVITMMDHLLREELD